MILLVALVVGIGFQLARVGGWGPALALHRRWEAARPYVVAYIRASPATFTYLFIVTITTWVLLGLDQPIVDAVLQAHSSNLAHLRSDPIRVLIRSAFWLDTIGSSPPSPSWPSSWPLPSDGSARPDGSSCSPPDTWARP